MKLLMAMGVMFLSFGAGAGQEELMVCNAEEAEARAVEVQEIKRRWERYFDRQRQIETTLNDEDSVYHNQRDRGFSETDIDTEVRHSDLRVNFCFHQTNLNEEYQRVMHALGKNTDGRIAFGPGGSFDLWSRAQIEETIQEVYEESTTEGRYLTMKAMELIRGLRDFDRALIFGVEWPAMHQRVLEKMANNPKHQRLLELGQQALAEDGNDISFR